MSNSTNPFEDAGRMRKVLKISIIATRIAVANGQDHAALAAWLRTISQAEWAALATLARCAVPSVPTQQLVIAAVEGTL